MSVLEVCYGCLLSVSVSGVSLCALTVPDQATSGEPEGHEPAWWPSAMRGLKIQTIDIRIYINLSECGLIVFVIDAAEEHRAPSGGRGVSETEALTSAPKRARLSMALMFIGKAFHNRQAETVNDLLKVVVR
ncbi:hypothetical protein J6590_041884 [Homalodisca vitripennis]|nr:hypothetical protein J6590_041884 [Homalodisca vitripennis]